MTETTRLIPGFTGQLIDPGHDRYDELRAVWNAMHDRRPALIARRLGSAVSQIELLSLGGAITRVAPDATAFPHRDAGWLINIPASWRSPAGTDKEVRWVRDTFAALQPVCSGDAHVNFMDHDEQAGDQVAYGGTRRLQQVKAAYDPHNVFRLNQNITPRAAA